MNWLKILAKCITRAGRQGLVRDLLKENLTLEAVTRYGAQGVNGLLGKVNDKEKLGAVALNLEQGAALASEIAAAIKDGEVSAAEAESITAKTQALLGCTLDQDKVDALVEYVASKVP